MVCALKRVIGSPQQKGMGSAAIPLRVLLVNKLDKIQRNEHISGWFIGDYVGLVWEKSMVMGLTEFKYWFRLCAIIVL